MVMPNGYPVAERSTPCQTQQRRACDIVSKRSAALQNWSQLSRTGSSFKSSGPSCHQCIGPSLQPFPGATCQQQCPTVIGRTARLKHSRPQARVIRRRQHSRCTAAPHDIREVQKGNGAIRQHRDDASALRSTTAEADGREPAQLAIASRGRFGAEKLANPLLPKLLPARLIPCGRKHWGSCAASDQRLCVELWRIELQTSSMP